MNKEWSELNKIMQTQIRKKIPMKRVLILYLIYDIG